MTPLKIYIKENTPGSVNDIKFLYAKFLPRIPVICSGEEEAIYIYYAGKKPIQLKITVRGIDGQKKLSTDSGGFKLNRKLMLDVDTNEIIEDNKIDESKTGWFDKEGKTELQTTLSEDNLFYKLYVTWSPLITDKDQGMGVLYVESKRDSAPSTSTDDDLDPLERKIYMLALLGSTNVEQNKKDKVHAIQSHNDTMTKLFNQKNKKPTQPKPAISKKTERKSKQSFKKKKGTAFETISEVLDTGKELQSLSNKTEEKKRKRKDSKDNSLNKRKRNISQKTTPKKKDSPRKKKVGSSKGDTQKDTQRESSSPSKDTKGTKKGSQETTSRRGKASSLRQKKTASEKGTQPFGPSAESTPGTSFGFPDDTARSFTGSLREELIVHSIPPRLHDELRQNKNLEWAIVYSNAPASFGSFKADPESPTQTTSEVSSEFLQEIPIKTESGEGNMQQGETAGTEVSEILQQEFKIEDIKDEPSEVNIEEPMNNQEFDSDNVKRENGKLLEVEIQQEIKEEDVNKNL